MQPSFPRERARHRSANAQSAPVLQHAGRSTEAVLAARLEAKHKGAMRNLGISGLVALMLCACPKKDDRADDAAVEAVPAKDAAPAPEGGDGERTAAIKADDPLYARVEGTSFKNTCASDGACMTGGCSSEVCSAEEGVNTTCEMPANGFPSQGASCGCVRGECVWFRGGAPVAQPSKPAEPVEPPSQPSKGGEQGHPCVDGKCSGDLKCIEYYGIAGPRGPKFTSCEISCADKKATCPNGQLCVTVADGPGRVCRAQGPDKPDKLDTQKKGGDIR